jgi:hypothetical protein
MVTACSFISTGRGNNTHAYTHSVGESHHVFLNLHTLRFYCLPDNYEIIGEFPPFWRSSMNTHMAMARCMQIAKTREIVEYMTYSCTLKTEPVYSSDILYCMLHHSKQLSSGSWSLEHQI